MYMQNIYHVHVHVYTCTLYTNDIIGANMSILLAHSTVVMIENFASVHMLMQEWNEHRRGSTANEQQYTEEIVARIYSTKLMVT